MKSKVISTPAKKNSHLIVVYMTPSPGEEAVRQLATAIEGLLAYVDAPMYESDVKLRCGSVAFERGRRYLCTRRKGHANWHRAGNATKTRKVWEA